MVRWLITCGLGVSPPAHLLSDYMRLILRCKVIGHTADGYPFRGQVPGKENHFVLAGYNGGGMPPIF